MTLIGCRAGPAYGGLQIRSHDFAMVSYRGAHRRLPHPRTGMLTDFLFTQRGRRLGYTRLRNGLLAATEAAALRAPDGGALIVTPHLLRHTCVICTGKERVRYVSSAA